MSRERRAWLITFIVCAVGIAVYLAARWMMLPLVDQSRSSEPPAVRII